MTTNQKHLISVGIFFLGINLIGAGINGIRGAVIASGIGLTIFGFVCVIGTLICSDNNENKPD